ncbi:MAG: hypothetical protein FJZ98_01345 [Chloroflexi bacterium]|nr:hypothetical protein [Chloroflexota bacterium]
MRISKIEKILIGIFFLGLWIFLAANAGAPIFSDEFMYIDAGLRNFAEPSYGNRYFHIYLQKFFMEIATTPLWGTRIFWGLLMALTGAQVYYHARTITKHSNILHGILGLAFFFSFPFIVEYSGEPAVDITAMAMVTLFISTYLYAVKHPQKRHVALGILGALVFLLFKTKETTIFIFYLFLGFGFNPDGRWDWRRMLPIIQPVLIGLAGGILLFVLLDGFILGQPFFAISPATFGAIFKHYDFRPGFFFGPANWYREYFLDDILLVFLLYIVSGFMTRRKAHPQLRLLWIYPLIMAAFVTLNMLKITFGFIERFYFPALPVLAMLAPQALRIVWPKERREWIGFGLMAAAAGALMLILRSVMMDYATSMRFDFARLLDSIYYPVLLSLLLASLIWFRRFHWAVSIILLFCIAAMFFSPLLYTHKYFVRLPKIQDRYDHLMAPFEEFSGQFDIANGQVLLVSAGLDRELEMLSDDPNDITGMYNFFFDRQIMENNVTIGYNYPLVKRFLLEKNIFKALVTADDWARLSSSTDILERYTPFPSREMNFYLLELNPACIDDQCIAP